MDPNPPPSAPVKPVRKYNRLTPLVIPVIPPLSSASPLQTPITPSPSTGSTQISLRAPKRTKWEKIDQVLTTYGFDNLGDFLATLFHRRVRGVPDPRTARHRPVVSAFLQGSTTPKMADIIPLLYNHPQSRPKRKHAERRAAAFSPHKPLTEIRFARPCLSAWATRLVGDRAYFRVGKLAAKTPNGPRTRRHLRATANERTPKDNLVTWSDTEFSVQGLADQYRDEDEFIWYLTECMVAPRRTALW